MTAKEKAKLRLRVRLAQDTTKQLNDVMGLLTEALMTIDTLVKLCPTVSFNYVRENIDKATMHVVNAQNANELGLKHIREVYGESSYS